MKKYLKISYKADLLKSHHKNTIYIIRYRDDNENEIIGDIIYIKHDNKNWNKDLKKYITHICSFGTHIFKVDKQYNTFEEVLIDIPELMLT